MCVCSHGNDENVQWCVCSHGNDENVRWCVYSHRNDEKKVGGVCVFSWE